MFQQSDMAINYKGTQSFRRANITLQAPVRLMGQLNHVTFIVPRSNFLRCTVVHSFKV